MEKASDVLIVEDEVIIAEAIADILKSAGYNKIRVTDSVENALEEIELRRPSVILTDINLGATKTGIDLGHILHRKYRIPFIYVTSYSSSDIIEKAKHTRPNAYIIKPFKNEDLLVAMELALFNSKNKYPSRKDEEVLMIKEGRAVTAVSLSNIAWVEAIGNYTGIHVSNGKKRVVRHSLKDIESRLNKKPFMRIHDSYLINVDYITETKPVSMIVNGDELPIGKEFEGTVHKYFRC